MKLSFRWFGIPRAGAAAHAWSCLRFDRGKYPYMAPIHEEDRVVRVFPEIPDGERMNYVPYTFDSGDVCRLSARIGAWRGVAALVARSKDKRRWSIELVSQWRDRAWRGIEIGTGRPN